MCMVILSAESVWTRCVLLQSYHLYLAVLKMQNVKSVPV